MAYLSQIKLSDTTYDISAWELRGKLSSSAVSLNNPGDGRIKYYYNVSDGLDGNMPAVNNANGILHLNTHGGEYSHQLGFSSDGNIYQRATNGSALSNSVAWKKILNSSNYTDYTVTKTGGGASGTWGINITGNAATATKLATARTISLTGEITGSGNFDGSGNVNINTNLNTYKLYNENSGFRWYHLQVNNSSNNGTAWYKMATVSNPSNYGTYEAHKFIGYYYQHNGNWEQEEIYKVPFQIILNMSNDTCTIYSSNLYSGSRLRVLKIGTRQYEIQYSVNQNHADFDIFFQYMASSGSSYCTIYSNNTTATSASSGFITTCNQLYSYGNRCYQADRVKSTVSTSKLYINGVTGANGYTYYNSSVYTSGSVLYGAAWNDYAEYRICNEKFKFGQVVLENGDDTLSIASQRLQRGCSVISDTFGFAIGETDEAKCPVAVSGRVLAYGYESREEFKKHIGWPVCSGPNGTVSIMTEEEEEKYPSRIIGTISAVPDYETWGTGNVEVNNRIWIKIK